ncbi:hypothetical protein ACFT5C_21545 [Streptomyces sp. NPDC057116]
MMMVSARSKKAVAAVLTAVLVVHARRRTLPLPGGGRRTDRDARVRA